MLNLYRVYRLGGLFETQKFSLVLLRVIQIVVGIIIEGLNLFVCNCDPFFRLYDGGQLEIAKSVPK